LETRQNIKDVIITSGGKNIAPYPIEDRIKNELHDFVSNCVVVGDKQKHLACLLTVKAVPDPATLEATDQMEATAWEWCHSQGCKPESVSDLVNNRHKYEPVWDAVMEALNVVNKESSSKAAKVRKFVILPSEFSISGWAKWELIARSVVAFIGCRCDGYSAHTSARATVSCHGM